jgi:glycosyltransferase involved in cell wall biosynthesis
MNSNNLTVIVTAYNVEKYIEKCIISTLNQNFKNYELIVVNDGSTDKTLEILNQFKNNDIITIINQTNQGVSNSRNNALKIAKGEWITFIDGDDWICENYFEKLFIYTNENDFVICSYNRCYENKNRKRVLNLSGKFNSFDILKKMIGPNDIEFKNPDSIDSLSATLGKLFKRNIIECNNLSFKDLKIIGTGEDLLFNISYLKNINDVYIIDEALYQYRRDNLNSITSVYKPNFFNQWVNKTNYLKNEINLDNPILKNSFENRNRINIIGLGINEMSNPEGYRAIIKNLNYFLNHENYKNIYQNINLKLLPIHWKLFFLMVKYKQVNIIFILLKIIKIIIKKK